MRATVHTTRKKEKRKLSPRDKDKPIKQKKQSKGQFVTCMECGRKMKRVTNTHLKEHFLTSEEYKEKYPGISLTATKIKSQQSQSALKRWETKPLSDESKKKIRKSMRKYHRRERRRLAEREAIESNSY